MRAIRSVIFACAACVFAGPLVPVAAQDEAAAKQDASTAMQAWMTEIDGGDYAGSWSAAGETFQHALTSDKWVAALQSVRTPLGRVLARRQVSSLYQASVPKPDGTTAPGGPFVIAQFDSSFANLKYAVETVTFEKQSDGSWRAAGYYIKPGS